MIRYRVYVGTGESGGVARQVQTHFPGATVLPAIGVWEGRVEASTVVEIITGGHEPDRVSLLAEDLRSVFQQGSVLITHEEIQAGAG